VRPTAHLDTAGNGTSAEFGASIALKPRLFRGVWRINRAQAAFVRIIAERVLKGESLGSIARDLNVREVRTPAGLVGVWRGANIRTMIASGRFCGWREWTPQKTTKAGTRHIVGLVHAVLSETDLTERVEPSAPDPSEAERLVTKLEKLAEMWGNDLLSRQEWTAARAPLLARQTELERQTNRVARSAILAWPQLVGPG
jgi:hypothetical protein